MVTFELGLEVGLGVLEKREEKGILNRRFNIERTERDESIE